MLGEHFTGPVFSAALELWVAARTDAALRDAVGPLEQRIGRETHRRTVELLGVDETAPGVRELVQATLDLVRGLGLANTLTDDTARRHGSSTSGPRCSTPTWPPRMRPGSTLGPGTTPVTSLGTHVSSLGRSSPTSGPRATSSTPWWRRCDAPTGWRAPTPADGWDVAHQVAHLAWTDEVAIAGPPRRTDREAAWDAIVVAAVGDPDGYVDAEAARAAAAADRLLERWRAARAALADALAAVPEGTRIPWFGPPMSATSMATARFMETWAHGRDVAAALGVELPPDDRVRHVVHLGVRTRGFAFPTAASSRRPTGPGRAGAARGERSSGPAGAAQRVTGTAHDFALVVTQRLHRAERT